MTSSHFDDCFADAAEELFSQLARSGVIYTPTGGSPVSLTAIVGAEHTEVVESENDGRVLRRERTVKIMTDSASPYGGVASPAQEDAVSVDGVGYRVEEIANLSANVAALKLLRTGSVQRAGHGYASPDRG